MSGIVEILGEKLMSNDGEVSTAEAFAGKKAIALYFSAHWCPPCRGFTPKFAEWYTKDLKGKGLEVVFCSSDKDEEQFLSYFKEQPWLALPYSDRERKEALSKKFKVQGIPTVVILTPDGEVITLEGREAVSGDPTGEDLPWKPPKFEDVFSSMKIVSKDGAVSTGADMKGKVFGFYFSAHWCPPCRGFTPQLKEWYDKDLKAKGFEIIFVSSDKDEAAFKDYFGEMSWLALDFADRKGKEKLSTIFKVQGIPSFVIIDKDFSVISKEGRAAISGDPTGVDFPWYPKPVANLKAGPGNIQEITTVVAFCETADKATQESIENTLTPVAKQYIDEAKAKGRDDPELAFVIATDAAGLSSKIRGMLKLPGLPPAKHEHPLEKKEDNPNGWGCDGCGQSGGGKDRYRCSQGCDFDFCGECNEKAGATTRIPPRLMIVDIPDNGGYYEGPEGDVNEASVRQLIQDYKDQKLERKQLS